MRYPNLYLWFVLVSSLDIMLTWVILALGGVEVNPVAALVINHWGLAGAIVFKYCLVLFVIIMCEWVSRRCDQRGRALAAGAIAISAIPVLWSFLLLAV